MLRGRGTQREQHALAWTEHEDDRQLVIDYGEDASKREPFQLRFFRKSTKPKSRNDFAPAVDEHKAIDRQAKLSTFDILDQIEVKLAIRQER